MPQHASDGVVRNPTTRTDCKVWPPRCDAGQQTNNASDAQVKRKLQPRPPPGASTPSCRRTPELRKLVREKMHAGVACARIAGEVDNRRKTRRGFPRALTFGIEGGGEVRHPPPSAHPDLRTGRRIAQDVSAPVDGLSGPRPLARLHGHICACATHPAPAATARVAGLGPRPVACKAWETHSCGGGPMGRLGLRSERPRAVAGAAPLAPPRPPWSTPPPSWRARGQCGGTTEARAAPRPRRSLPSSRAGLRQLRGRHGGACEL